MCVAAGFTPEPVSMRDSQSFDRSPTKHVTTSHEPRIEIPKSKLFEVQNSKSCALPPRIVIYPIILITMKTIFTILFSGASLFAFAQQPSTKSVLLEQLKNTHNVKNWFVPVNIAVEGLTPEKAAWKDKGGHSVGQLTYHLLFWNERQLKDFKGEKKDAFGGNNEETFDKFDQKQWADIVKRLDKVLTDMEKWVESASDDQIRKYASTIANVSAHNAYHTGQIISVRKAQGSWNPEKGVK